MGNDTVGIHFSVFFALGSTVSRRGACLADVARRLSMFFSHNEVPFLFLFEAFFFRRILCVLIACVTSVLLAIVACVS